MRSKKYLRLVTPPRSCCRCSSICTEALRNKNTVLPFSPDPRIEEAFKALAGIFSRAFSRNVRHLGRVTSSQHSCQLKPTGVCRARKQSAPTRICTGKSASVKKGPCNSARPPPSQIKRSWTRQHAQAAAPRAAQLQVAQQGQQVHFGHTNLHNLIRDFVDWRIKPLARISSLCSGPRCGKQIFLSHVEFGSVPPSLYIPRQKSWEEKKKRVEGEKRSLFKWSIRPNHKSLKVQCKISDGPLLRQTLIHCLSSAGI